ncbi:MAG: cyclodeaminase/cyclohydrolase family protein [Phycisphaerales bacterium]
MDHLVRTPLATLLDQIAAKAPTPGGGAVAGIVGALGCALGEMVVAYSLGKKSMAEHQSHLELEAGRLVVLRGECLRRAEADAAAYARLNTLQRLPADHPTRATEFLEALHDAIAVPMGLAGVCAETLDALVGLAGRSNPFLKSDLAIAGVLALAGAEAARWNVVVNLTDLAADEREAKRTEIDAIVDRCASAKSNLDSLCA